MKRSLGLVLGTVVLCCFSVLPAFAGGHPAAATGSDESLTPVCRALQVEVQNAVGNEDPTRYKNHGAYVSTVAHMVGIHVGVDIDEECASCIISQFARRIPIEDQTPCGPDSPNPECEGAQCGAFLPCNVPNSCFSPVCVTTAEGGGLCVEGSTPCAGLVACPNGTGDCPAGSICAVLTCCGSPVCVPPSAFCEPTAGQAPVTTKTAPIVDGPSIATMTGGKPGDAQVTPWGQVKSIYKD